MPSPDPFTHDFKFQIGEDGSKFIEGQVEFNKDDKVSYHLKASSIPLQHQTFHLFLDLMDTLKRLFEESDGIKLIKVKKIEE